MPYPSCGPPKSTKVKPHTRAGPPKRRKRKPKQTVGQYWTCVNERTGRTCGTKHRRFEAAVQHRKRLNLRSFRAGSGRPWDVQKRGG